jgi:hypothetical protein
MLVRAEVFERLPKPWFNLTWVDEIQDFVGEDWWFCGLLEKEGLPIYIDHRASMTVGHVGMKEYTHADVKERDDGTNEASEPDGESAAVGLCDGTVAEAVRATGIAVHDAADDGAI